MPAAAVHIAALPTEDMDLLVQVGEVLTKLPDLLDLVPPGGTRPAPQINVKAARDIIARIIVIRLQTDLARGQG